MKINFEELRIGNWVMYKPMRKPMYVLSITDSEICLDCPDNAESGKDVVCCDNPNDIEGIILTDEIMAKIGMLEPSEWGTDKSTGELFRTYKCLEPLHCVEERKNDGWTFYIVNGINIIFLHSLQNIFNVAVGSDFRVEL